MRKLFPLSSIPLIILYQGRMTSHLKAVENIYYGHAEIPSAITERDVFKVLKLDRLNSDVIYSFTSSFV